MRPLVSVIIPTRNRAHCLPRALDSVCAQEGLGELFDVEIIVVDDASSDATSEVVGRYDGVRCVRLAENRGVAGALNEGLRASTGTYLVADDLVHSRLLEVGAASCQGGAFPAAAASPAVMKTLLVLSPGYPRWSWAEARRREAVDECPKESLVPDTLNADVLDGEYLEHFRRRSPFAALAYRLLPRLFLQALLAFALRRRYDAVVIWNDECALHFAFLLRLMRARVRHVVLATWFSPPEKARLLRCLQRGIDRIVVTADVQADLLVELGYISPERIVAIPHFVDHEFWRPMNAAIDGISSAGDSRRDYATLIEAVRGLDIRCRIATRAEPRAENGSDSSDRGVTSWSLAAVGTPPGNVVCGPAAPVELRTIYARSRFVVVPLFASFENSGITTVTEAMAMGKAVICSRIRGQTEFVEDGVTGILVPHEDPGALRDAIVHLWNHPEVAERMGREGRRRAEQVFTLTRYAANVREIVSDLIAGRRTSLPTIAEQMRAVASTVPRPT